VAGDGSVVGLDDVDLDAALEVFLEVRRDPRIQLEQATQAAQAFLKALGVDLTRPGMDDTRPGRPEPTPSCSARVPSGPPIPRRRRLRPDGAGQADPVPECL
jgi:hypothetical protein